MARLTDEQIEQFRGKEGPIVFSQDNFFETYDALKSEQAEAIAQAVEEVSVEVHRRLGTYHVHLDNIRKAEHVKALALAVAGAYQDSAGLVSQSAHSSRCASLIDPTRIDPDACDCGNRYTVNAILARTPVDAEAAWQRNERYYIAKLADRDRLNVLLMDKIEQQGAALAALDFKHLTVLNALCPMCVRNPVILKAGEQP